MYYARFTRGNRQIVIDGTTYRLTPDFAPPALNTAANLSTGSSANAYQGGRVVSVKFSDREFGFPVQVTGTTRAGVNAAVRRLVSFLEAGDDTPLYFEYRDDASVREPLWGQLGAPLRYEVKSITAGGLPNFLVADMGSQGETVVVSMTVAPFALGRKQRLASALGGVWEDTTLTADRSSLGLRIMEATTNKMTNPVFTNATWNTGWTAAASIIEKQNTDNAYSFEGSFSSAYLISKAATNNTYTQSINAGNTNKHSFSAIVARPDGAAVDSNDCVIWYNAALTTTFTALGYNGWYLATADNVTGINAGTATGIQVKSGRAVYLIAFQMEEKAYHTPITHGDMLGSSWAGTVGASTSARTAGRVRVTVDGDTFSVGQWAVHLVWRPDYASTATGDRYLFSCGSTNIRGYYNATDDKYYLTDNANTISTAAQTFNAGDKIDLIFCGGPSGLVIYKNGANVATGATYTPPAAPTYVYIGTDDSAANHAGGVFLLFDTYGEEISQAEATAIYTAAGGLISSGFNVGTVPWFWTTAGDNVVTELATFGGIPGSFDELDMTLATSGGPNVLQTVWLGLHEDAPDDYVRPDYRFVFEGSGTGGVPGNRNSDSYNIADLSVIPRGAVSISVRKPNNIGGPVHFFTRVRSESGTVAATISPFYFTNNNSYEIDCSASLSTSYKDFYLGGMVLEKDPNPASPMTLGVKYSAAAGGARVDYAIAVNGSLAKITRVLKQEYDEGATATEPTSLRIIGNTTHYVATCSYHASMIGDPIGYLSGGKITTLFYLSADHGSVVTTYGTPSATFSPVYITPRWGLL